MKGEQSTRVKKEGAGAPRYDTQSLAQTQLVKMIKQKEFFTFEELQGLRKSVEEHQQIQMTLKNNNPGKVHIQCKHFKSKKCCFQLTFKVDCEKSQKNEVSEVSTSFSKPEINSKKETPSLLCAVSSSSYAPHSISSQGAIPQQSRDAAFSNFENIMHLFDEKSANALDSLTLGQAASCVQRGDSCTSPFVDAANQDEINLSPQQVLLPKCGAIMEQDEGREGVSKSCVSGPQLKAPEQQEQLPQYSMRENLNNTQQSTIFYDTFDSVLDKTDNSDIKSLIESDDTDFDINNIILFGQHLEEEGQAISQVIPSSFKLESEEIISKYGIVFFRLCNFRINHRNHPVMSDKEYSVHLAKRWLEGHDDKIKKIYSNLREQRGDKYKVTPKIIKKILQEEFDIDIYARCTEPDHHKLLKKKLDNLIKGIRLRERVSAGNEKAKHPTTTTSKGQNKTINKKNATNNTSTNINSTPQLISIKNKQEKTEIEQEENQEKNGQQINFSHSEKSSFPQIRQNEEIEIESSFECIKIQDAPSYLLNQNNQQSFMKLSSQLSIPQLFDEKIFKEEWESFLEFDQSIMLQNAH